MVPKWQKVHIPSITSTLKKTNIFQRRMPELTDDITFFAQLACTEVLRGTYALLPDRSRVQRFVRGVAYR